MLVNNFSAGILGGALAIFSLYIFGPIITWISDALGSGVNWLIEHSLLPLASIIIEPAKVLFLNNAINHGVLGPLGVNDAQTTGKAIHFLLETNPGPGFGILLACSLFGRAEIRATAPGAAVIQFLGGIHEVYFPYVLAAPRLILAAIAGGASGVFIFSWADAGLTATPSPGSIIAIMAVTPKGGYVPVLAGIFVATAVSFVIAAVLLKFGRSGDEPEIGRHAARP
jgi:PTS system mannitol-specific IIC component